MELSVSVFESYVDTRKPQISSHGKNKLQNGLDQHEVFCHFFSEI